MIVSNHNPLIFRRGRTRALSKPKQVFLIGYLLLSFTLLVSLVSSSLLSSIAASPSKRRRHTRHQNQNQYEYQSHNTARSSTPSSVPCDGRAVVPANRKACGFYVWDFPSALMYKWCHYLLKDRIYEGKGGYLFVRYESNSILKLLYPCSRYSPNKCMICGGSYPDHLELWWSKHLYSPYDQYLDNTYNDALVIGEEIETRKRTNRGRLDRNRTSRNRNRNRRSSVKTSSTPLQTLSDPPTFNFHKRYVEDVSEIVRGIKDPREKMELVKNKLSAKKWNHMLIPCQHVTYVAPYIGGYNDTKPYTKKDASIDFCTMLLHSCIDSTINLQLWEFTNKKLKNSRASNRL
jgi:hypothetical protein